MDIIKTIQESVTQAVLHLYNEAVIANDVNWTPTRKEFEGDYTILVFPFTKIARKKPDEIAKEIGDWLTQNQPLIANYNVVQGFLNLSIQDSFWVNYLESIQAKESFGNQTVNGKRVMIEFSSPNTNKPLHLGHIRNILLGWSCSKILKAAGYDVIRTQVVNDRGIAICKSMLAWKKFANGATPTSEKIKSDHFVGDYYVLFEQKFKAEYQEWQGTTVAKNLFDNRTKKELGEKDFFAEYKNKYFNEYSILGKEAREMLLAWEANEPSIMALWKQMNQWVYDGFNETYQKLGVTFDKSYYESQTFKIGKETISKGLEKGIFYQKEDDSVWIDLTDAKLDHKVVLRGDGTSLYITQDIGMAPVRYAEFKMDKLVYVVADEQNYHFQVLFEILKRLDEPYANGLFHLSYGMVDLPTGKMKSREGTVVDADDLIAEVISDAKAEAEARTEIGNYTPKEQAEVARRVGMAALKYHIIKVNPKKRMVFDPQESVAFEGHTGPYIQYNYVRTAKVVNKALEDGVDFGIATQYADIQIQEKELIKKIYDYERVIIEAAENYDPSLVANYLYDLAVLYSKFYHDLRILQAETAQAKAFRVQITSMTKYILQHGMDLLGIEMPERM